MPLFNSCIKRKKSEDEYTNNNKEDYIEVLTNKKNKQYEFYIQERNWRKQLQEWKMEEYIQSLKNKKISNDAEYQHNQNLSIKNYI